jgi:pimeloyl-ACP methyl ester carboxylesterase
MKDSRIRLDDGREIAYTDIGDPGWPCVLFFHGAPMSRLHLAYLEEPLQAARLRVISPDRPGYGGSSPRPGRSMADWPSDVAALADALALERFVVAGHSSGGPYAVACAAVLGSRVSGGIVFGGVTDMGWSGAWDDYIDSERHLMRLGDEASAVEWCEQHYGADGSSFLAASDFDFPAVDNALMADERIGGAIVAAVTEAFRQGVGGYAQDAVVQGRPWPFDPGRIAAPMEVVHGELDDAMPVAHSRHTAELIAGSRLRIVHGHGHMTTLSLLPALASDLARAQA